MKYIYRKFHPFTKRANEAKRRARKYNVQGSFNKWTIETLYVKQSGKCNICFEILFGKFEVDHIKPLSKGGSNDWENLQILCPKCNKVKGNSYDENMLTM